MKIGTRLLIGFAVMMVLLLISTVVAYWGLTTVGAGVEKVQASVEAVQAQGDKLAKASDLHLNFIGVLIPPTEYVVRGDRGQQSSFKVLEGMTSRRLDELEAQPLDDQERAALQEVKNKWAALDKTVSSIMALDDPLNPQARTDLAKAQTQADEAINQAKVFMTAVTGHSEEIGRAANDTRQAANQARTTAMTILLAVAAISVVSGSVASFLIARSITTVVVHLTDLANRISMGELDVTVRAESKDELGDLARSFERMRASLKLAMDRLQVK